MVNEKYEIDAILEKMKTTTDFTSTHRIFVRAISQLSKDEVIDLKANLLAAEDTYGFDAIIAAEKSVSYVRQLNIEEEQQSDAVSEYLESLKQMISIGKGTSLKYIQRILLRWYTPLTQEIEEEVRLIEQKVAGNDRTQYGPCMLLLPAEKLAVIALDEVLNSILKTGNSGVHLTKIASNIGESIESEVCLIKLKKGKAGLRPWQQDLIKNAYSQGTFRRQRSKLNSLIEDEPWSIELKVKIGAALASFVIETALTETNKPAFEYSKRQLGKGSIKRVGILKLNDDQFKQIVDKDLTNITPRYLPMLCPPKSWDNKRKDGCYYRLNSQLMRSRSRTQLDALKRANMSDVTEGLNYLGKLDLFVYLIIFILLYSETDGLIYFYFSIMSVTFLIIIYLYIIITTI
jgi:DNA-directed RNA polymerase